jgi:methylmalonyl-CoA mutase N-terminal domain/subunit
MMQFCGRRVPEFHPVSISGYHIREAGATAVQELAFTLADGFTYVEEAIKSGLKIDEFAPRLSFFFNAHMNFFEEIAKYRAARKIWAEAMRKRFKAKNPKSWWLRFHAQTAGCSLTEQQPENNIVRTTLEALSAVLGGAQSLHTNSLDETISLPSEWAVQVALRTQQILAYETGIPSVADPLGGSYYLETLTQKMEEEAKTIFGKIKELGGVVKAIKLGYFQREIAQSARRDQKEVEEGKQVIVGVNRYQETVGWTMPVHKIPEAVEKEQVTNLRQLKKRRSGEKVKRALFAIQKAARGKHNLMPYLLEGAHAYATLGEMIGALREVFGEYEEPPIF